MKTFRRPWLAGVFVLVALSALAGIGCGDDDDEDEIEAEPTPPEPDPCALTVVAGSGWVRASSACDVRLTFRTRIALAGSGGSIEWVASTDYPVEELTDAGARWSGLDCLPDVDLAWTVADAELRLDLSLALADDCQDDLYVAGAEVASAVPAEGGGLWLATAGGPLHVLQQGYDSWSFAGVLRLIEQDAPPLCDETACAGGNNDSQKTEEAGHSWWMMGLRGQFGPPAVVAGALSAKLLKPRVAVEPHPGARHGLRLIWGMTGESVRLAAGETVAADPFYFGVSDSEDAALSRYAAAAADETPPLAWDGPEMRGWASWYEYFSRVQEQDVIDNIAPTTDPLLVGLGLNVIQLDDGYMPAWGDWTANEKFPSGLEELADTIEASGMVPGIWMAPFLVEQSLAPVTEHPDWFLVDADGNAIVWSGFGTPKCRVLDPTHPGAAEWLTAQVAAMVAQGYTYLKLDFLFAGAFEGQHFDADATSLSAFAEGMRTIREAAGDGVYILASGEPILPIVGHAHAARTSTDVVSSFPGDPLYFVIPNIARFNASRYFMDRAWFVNDPDNLVLRHRLTDREARVALVSNLLGGSAVFLGDDLTALPPQRWAMLVLAAATQLADSPRQAVPLDLFDAPCDGIIRNVTTELIRPKNHAPAVWLADSASGGKLLAVFAFGDDPVTRYFDRTTIGLDATVAYTVTDLFEDDSWMWAYGPLEVTAPKRDVRLLRIEVETE